MDTRLVWFEKLYDKYADAIFRYLAYKLNDRERAKELTQEVFLKTWQYVISDKPIDHEKAFLYRIARNLFINELRIVGRTTSLSRLEEDGFDTPDTKVIDGKTFAEHQELMDRLGEIKDSYQDVLILRYINGLSVKEIAETLEENETNISMRIKRGIEALQTLYNKT